MEQDIARTPINLPYWCYICSSQITPITQTQTHTSNKDSIPICSICKSESIEEILSEQDSPKAYQIPNFSSEDNIYQNQEPQNFSHTLT